MAQKCRLSTEGNSPINVLSLFLMLKVLKTYVERKTGLEVYGLFLFYYHQSNRKGVVMNVSMGNVTHIEWAVLIEYVQKYFFVELLVWSDRRAYNIKLEQYNEMGFVQDSL
jgi:hypothetical protein